MAVAVAEVERSRRIAAPTTEVYARIDHVDGIVALMESLRHHEPLDAEGAYRFRLRSYSALGYRFQPEAELRLTWTPGSRVNFEPVGDSARRAAATGAIELREDGGATTASIRVRLELDLPIPGLLTGAAGAVLRHELAAGFDRMLRRLEAGVTEPAEDPDDKGSA